MLIPALVALAAAGTVLAAGFAIHRWRLTRRLNERVPLDPARLAAAEANFGAVEAAAMGVSLFDVLYNTSRLDPFALSGADHLHHAQHFSDLGDLLGYLKDDIIQSEAGSAAWRKMIHKYKGYTGEEVAFEHLRDAGHDVVAPESGTQEGWDALVDGEPYNVKITDNPAYIQQHLNAHPDVDVYTNAEMADAFGDHPRVMVDPDLSAQNAFHATSDTFAGAHDLGDSMNQIPWITLAISGTKNLYGVAQGNKDIGTALEHTALDGVGVGVGGWAGGKAGLAVGLMLAPVTGGLSAVLIPTASTLLGSLMGVLGGKTLTGWFKTRHLRSAIEVVQTLAQGLAQAFLSGLDGTIGVLQLEHNDRADRHRFLRKTSGNWVQRWFLPSLMQQFHHLAIRRIGEECSELVRFLRNLASEMSVRSSDEAGLLLLAQGEAVLCGDAELLSTRRELASAVDTLENERRKLT